MTHTLNLADSIN